MGEYGLGTRFSRSRDFEGGLEVVIQDSWFVDSYAHFQGRKIVQGFLPTPPKGRTEEPNHATFGWH
jgi:hypothetical protein